MTAKSRATLNSDADTNLATNGVGGITATDVRTIVKDLADSAMLAEDIGTVVQAHSATLDATTASFTTTLESKLAGIASGATANDTDSNLKNRANHTGTQLASTISDFSTAADARVSAAIGDSVQAYSANLAALAGLTGADNKGFYFTGAGSMATYDLTAAGRALLDDADAAAQLVTLGAIGNALLTTRGDIITRGASAPQRLALGASGQVLKSDGMDAAWGTPQVIVLASSAVAVSHTGNTNETVLATVTIPAGAMGLNGALRITSTWSHPGGSANNKTMRIRLGGISGTTFMFVVLTANVSSQDPFRIIQNRNSASSQICKAQGSLGTTSNSANVTGTVNTANAQDLVFTAQLANGGETITLEQYTVELILP